MRIDSEFSKYAAHYGSYNVIQEKVAVKLLSHVNNKPKNILDLGCGHGALVEKIDWEYNRFVGVDFAKGMLELHPKSKIIECIYGDFNDDGLYKTLKQYNFDYVLSSSALQWAQDLEKVFSNIKSLDTQISLAIFTSGTFETLHKTASLEPLLLSKDEIYTIQKKYFDVNFEVVNYRLEFENTREMFRYIKKSGVSGSRNALSFKETKKLMDEYPLNYLEFEVAYIYS
ncbi:methyltransferase domain-containing protein [Sulfurimonas marina]|uniref:Methyltransferase domain-containing protein n=1 Tax=Sulfurimonas marina TaxID=2590551 RepID=A0A7M1B0N5_9BACT|nr:methyltransferase domain-containing protein [Sulfurimonas marina]QOP42278.1 methyltransferase domain-containing protein [Sulfurimonas marina]